MIYMDDNTKERIQKLKANSIYFLINFDNVITDKYSCDTWKAIIDNSKLRKKYTKKTEELDYKCRKIELDSNIGLDSKCNCIKDIWKEDIELLKGLNIDDKKLRHIINKKSNLNFRCGVKDFLKTTYEKNIPVIIISDGISEVIECLLNSNNCYYNNITVISNKILSNIDNDENKIIHPLNRNELSIPDEIKCKISDRKISILLASSINDINMLSKTNVKDSIKAVFLDHNINENFDTFLNYFNIIYTHNTPFDKITEKLKVM